MKATWAWKRDFREVCFGIRSKNKNETGNTKERNGKQNKSGFSQRLAKKRGKSAKMEFSKTKENE